MKKFGFKLIRATVWCIATMSCAWVLDIEWTGRILALCIFASAMQDLAYADYSGVKKAWKSAHERSAQ